MKVKKLKILGNKIGSRGCIWSSLNAPGTETPLSDAYWNLGEWAFLIIGPIIHLWWIVQFEIHYIATPRLCLHFVSRKYDAREREQCRNYPLIHKQGRVSTSERREEGDTKMDAKVTWRLAPLRLMDGLNYPLKSSVKFSFSDGRIQLQILENMKTVNS